MASTRRQIARFAVVALAVVVLAEGGARALAPFLPEPLSWPDRSTQVKAAQMDALGCADVVFVGDSMARDGLVPDTFTDADPSGRRSYNGALDAATPSHLAAWVTDEVQPALDPDVVVLALSSFDVNRNNQAGASAFDSYRASPGGRTDVFARLQEAVAAHSALVRHRSELRQPTAVWDATGRAIHGDREARDGAGGIAGLIGSAGEGLSRAELRFTGPTATTRFLTDELLGDFDLSESQLESAQALVNDLQDDGVEVVLLVMPVTDDFVELHPGGADDVEAFRSAVAQVGRETGAPVLDLLDAPYGDEEFADTHHLNASGADRLTRDVAAALPPGASTCD